MLQPPDAGKILLSPDDSMGVMLSGFIEPVLRGAVLPVLLTLTLLPVPAEIGAQGLDRLLSVLDRGGTWVQVPVEDGRGSVRTARLPVGRAPVRGCGLVWSGHSGRWTVHVTDPLAGRVLDVTVEPGEPVRFEHEPESWARLEVDVAWSEPRDTTLFLWVGLERLGSGEEGADPCEPRR